MFAAFYVCATFVLGLVSIELGAEFFAAMNTALNLVTIMYVQRKHRELKPKVEHIEAVADALDVRQEGGQRSYDPPAV